MPSYTLANYRTRVSAILGLDTTGGGAEELLVDSWVNEGIEDVLLKTRCKQSKTTISLSAGTSEYTLSTSILLILEAFTTSSNQNYSLQRISHKEMIERQLVTPASSSPVRYYTTAGFDQLIVYPTPSASETITIWYVPRHTTLSTSSASASEIPAEFHELVEFYALWRGADYDDSQVKGIGEIYRERYETGLRRLRRTVWQKGGRRLARAQVGRRPSVTTADNSADW